ncbi:MULTISPECIES: flavodoxin domain-containing protein [Clostridium]|jgi:flavodoxin short chain|uniref:Putative flavoprotein n=1 Tax=Clostridium saccharoperbutylacetonicum N1-4(HMT) TaxID=931276 RepID=M1MQ92_9CLOT|nr:MULTISPECIES: flavodoxin domain-containing protein [Clostridium]AGF58353.1 putative flavoprotein [Clostridium saccharoperbutylacetonicum N1-4(HMT)]AQR97046.1 flavodoxin [Clostridium saccharoperbutylacetonicum]NRT60869.1 flavodoxin short chain [Clostridium saccharoperbutylacetonicum]NSB24183.1 flavodoxin short chain [Clostridium saccharoperbutylacetonicum]NSB32926.1 flavodoxin short chain [Clostridium saccharoperbutylacetonicum]
MKKVSIIYWSCGGNIEILANKMAEGAREQGANVNLKHVADATIEDVLEADCLAFGCPALDATKIEQEEMRPFLQQLESFKDQNENKNCILFATYGWIDNSFMKIWKDEMSSYGFNVIGDLAVKDSITKKHSSMIMNLSKQLVK